MPTIAPDRAASHYAQTFTKVEELQEEVKTLLARIQEVYSEIAQVSARRSRGPGRPPRAVTFKRKGKTRAPRGALKAAIHKVLSGGKAVRPADIVKKLPQTGYKSASEPRVLYTSVYLALKRDPAIKKTSKGFQLKAGKK